MPPQLIEKRSELRLRPGQALDWQAELGPLALSLRLQGPGEGPQVAVVEVAWQGPYELLHLRQGIALDTKDQERSAQGDLILAWGLEEEELRWDPDGPSTHSAWAHARWAGEELAIALAEQILRR